MKQAEFAFNSFHTRREHEWKITLGLWAVLVLATQFLYGKPLRFPSWVWVCLPIVVTIVYGTFLGGISQALQSDKAVADSFRAYAVEILAGRNPGDIRIPPRATLDWRFFGRNWTLRFQLATTIMVSIGCAFVLAKSTDPLSGAPTKRVLELK